MSQSDQGAGRPLSPHLQIYKPMLTMMMSMAHRLTGLALYFGTVLLAWWLLALSSGPDSFAIVQGFFSSIIGRAVLFGYTWALIHHMFGGFRHFVWDTGRGFDLAQVEWAAQATLAGSIILTVVVWAIGYLMM